MAQRNRLPRARRRHRRAPWLGVCAAIGCLLAAPLAAAAGVNVEVRGVDEQLRANVLAYLSFERYSKGGVGARRRHGRAAAQPRRARSAGGAAAVRLLRAAGAVHRHRAGPRRRGRWSSTSRPASRCGSRTSTCASTARARATRCFSASSAAPAAARRRSPEPRASTRTSRATCSAPPPPTATSTRKPDPQRAAGRSAQPHGRHRPRARDRRALPLRPHHHRAARRQGEPGAPLPALPPGRAFDLTQVLRTQFALDDCAVLRQPRGAARRAGPHTHTVPVDIRADASRRHRYSFGAGYATDTGVRGTLGFEDRRVNDSGHSFSVELQVAQVTRYNLQSHYMHPGRRPGAREHLSLQRHRSSSRPRRRHRHTRCPPDRASPTSPAAGRRVAGERGAHHQRGRQRHAPPSGCWCRSSTSPRCPRATSASRCSSIRSSPSSRARDSSLGSDANFIQLHMQAERVFRLGSEVAPAAARRGGRHAGVATSASCRPCYRFFAGGDNSVRGFAYNELSPTEPVCTTGPRRPVPAAPPTAPARASPATSRSAART